MRNAPMPRPSSPVTVVAFVASLVALAVAGCVTPDEPEDPLVGVCPHWTPREAPRSLTFDVPAHGNVTNEWVPRDASGQPRPVDGDRRFERITVRIEGLAADDGLLLSARDANGTDLLLYEHGATERPRSYPVAVLESVDGRVFDIYLSSVADSAGWHPAPITLEWATRNSTASVTVEVTLWDRVCGIP